MLVLEVLDGHFALPFLAVLWWGLAYVTLCMVYVLLSTLILLGLGKIKKQMFFAGPVAFLLSFSALFLLAATLGQYYLINLPLLILKEGLSVPLFIYGIWLICLVILMWMLSQDKQVLSFLIDKEWYSKNFFYCKNNVKLIDFLWLHIKKLNQIGELIAHKNSPPQK